MSLGRILDLTLFIAALFGILIVQTTGAVILEELRTEFNEDADASFNQQQINDENFIMVTKWVPTFALFGVIMLLGYREFRRQRQTAFRGPRI